MADQYKLNYLLVGLIVLGIAVLMYLLIFIPILRLHPLSAFFLMAEIGSFWLYANFFLKHKGWRASCVMIGVFLVIFTILGLFFNATFSSYFVLILFFWISGCIHFIIHILWNSKNQANAINYFFLYVSLPLWVMVSTYFLILSGQNHPLVQDEFLMAVDGTLGIYPSLIMGRFIRALPQSFSDAVNLLYKALPLAVILVYTKRQSLEKSQHYLIVEILLLGIVGFSLYNIIPACGSSNAFYDTWPDSLPAWFLQDSPQLIYCPTLLPRNCLPSLHMAWLVCLCRHAWLCDPLTKMLILVLALGNLIAMFGIGAHYLVDLIVGFALANCIGGFSSFQLSWSNKARWQAMLFGGLLCITWYVIIMYGIPFLQLSKILAWCIFFASILLSIYLEWKLFQEHKKSIKSSPGMPTISSRTDAKEMSGDIF